MSGPWENRPWDAAIVALYLVISFVLGILAPRILGTRRQAEEGYFLAGRKMTGWINGISMAATYVNADVAPVYCGMAAVVGLSVSWWYFSRFGLLILIASMLFAVRWRQLGIATGPEFFGLRYGGRGGVGLRIYNSLFSVFLGNVPWLGAGLLGVHMIFGPVFGIEDKSTTLLLVLPVLLVYVWISGFAGVLVTDAFQSFIIVAANVALTVLVLAAFGGPQGLVSAIQAAHPEQAGEILSAYPVPGHRVFGPLTVAAWMIVTTLGAGGGVVLEGQRLFSCRSGREAAKVGIWTEVTLFLMLLILTLPALGVIADRPEIYHANAEEREKAYAYLLSNYLPVGFLGLALAALLASVMSTLSGQLNYCAQTLVHDVYRPVVGEPSERRALWMGRVFTVVVALSAIFVVYASHSLIGIAVLMVGMFAPAAVHGWAQWWWWRANLWSWMAASIGGPLVYLGLGAALKQWDWWQAQLDLGEAQAQSMAMVQSAIALGITTVLWSAVALLTPSERMDVLMRFYRRARPMGWWGPVRAAVHEEDGAPAGEPRHLILAGLGASILGFSWIALGILGLSHLYVGRYGEAVLSFAAATILALLFKRYFNWHVGRLEWAENLSAEAAEPQPSEVRADAAGSGA